MLDLTASTKLYILGTGTPNPNPERAGSSYLVLVNDEPYLIDFGSGVVRRVAALTKAWGGDLEIDTEDLKHAFLKHACMKHVRGNTAIAFVCGALIICGRGVQRDVFWSHQEMTTVVSLPNGPRFGSSVLSVLGGW